MKQHIIRGLGLLLLIGGSLFLTSPRFWIADNASDARRDAERQRQQQANIRRDEERRRIRQEEEEKQNRRLNPGHQLCTSAQSDPEI
jgi:hypothetical protein